jgi:hypothetical protein
MGYRRRLRLEGAVLALCGAAAAAALLLEVDAAREGPANTIAQLAAVALALALLGPRAVRAWAAEAEPVEAPVSGDPTPLWQLPLVLLALGAPFAALDAWDAVLRVAGGCVLVGLAQALLLERAAAREEARLGGVLVRLPGSGLLRGTRLGLRR